MSMKILIVGLLAASVACSPERNINGGEGRDAVAKDGDAPSSRTTAAAPAKVTVLFFGTSLTAGYGLDPSVAFPNLIARTAAGEGMPIVVVNAGLSGETSAGALRRIDWTLRKPVDIVVLETGGNDALRALDPDTLQANIRAIVSRIRSAQPGARILLAVMEAPPNLGARYTSSFRNAYATVAKNENLTLVPFLLDKVAGRAELNQADGVHPNEKGERIVADNVWRTLRPVVQEVYRNRPKG
ncbi:MAG: arylesterase [Gemmatimonadales bacterium]